MRISSIVGVLIPIIFQLDGVYALPGPLVRAQVQVAAPTPPAPRGAMPEPPPPTSEVTKSEPASTTPKKDESKADKAKEGSKPATDHLKTFYEKLDLIKYVNADSKQVIKEILKAFSVKLSELETQLKELEKTNDENLKSGQVSSDKLQQALNEKKEIQSQMDSLFSEERKAIKKYFSELKDNLKNQLKLKIEQVKLKKLEELNRHNDQVRKDLYEGIDQVLKDQENQKSTETVNANDISL